MVRIHTQTHYLRPLILGRILTLTEKNILVKITQKSEFWWIYGANTHTDTLFTTTHPGKNPIGVPISIIFLTTSNQVILASLLALVRMSRDGDSSPWTRTRVGLESRSCWTRTQVSHIQTRDSTRDMRTRLGLRDSDFGTWTGLSKLCGWRFDSSSPNQATWKHLKANGDRPTVYSTRLIYVPLRYVLTKY